MVADKNNNKEIPAEKRREAAAQLLLQSIKFMSEAQVASECDCDVCKIAFKIGRIKAVLLAAAGKAIAGKQNSHPMIDRLYDLACEAVDAMNKDADENNT